MVGFFIIIGLVERSIVYWAILEAFRGTPGMLRLGIWIDLAQRLPYRFGMEEFEGAYAALEISIEVGEEIQTGELGGAVLGDKMIE
jgi:hypothetical protein